MNSTGEMLCAGILPINQMREYTEPAAIIATRVPQHLLNAIYNIHIIRLLDVKDNNNRPPTCHEFLQAYCKVKGYERQSGGKYSVV